MKARIASAVVCTLTFIATGCDRQADTAAVVSEDTEASTTQTATEPDTRATDTEQSKIAWFEGSVDEAFAHAQAEQMPIFLYWGAVWCPPCHEIKVTVFDTQDFVDRSRLFVPVYLDGDTENAQAIGERFGVLGYPTMIVFSPDGVEITRIPGGIDIQAYASVLDLTLQNTKPVSELLANVVDRGEMLSAADCSLVAFYSWGQNQTILAERDAGEVFRRLYDACPVELAVERSRLYLNHLDNLIAAAQSQDNPVPLSAEQKEHALKEVNRFIDNYSAVKANIYTALFDGADYTRALTEPGSAERKELTRKYLKTFDRVAGDDSIFKTERLYSAIGKMGFERIEDEDAGISEKLKQETRELIAWADRTTTDVYERQTVINGASNVLEEAGMSEEARVLLTAEIEKSRQPYYFMVSLADVEQADGNYTLALQLLKRAYDAATGPATRFQWGNYYVSGLIDMTPEDADTIQAAILSVLGEIEAEGAFYQRNKVRLRRLEAKLMNWNADRQYDQSIEFIRTRVQAICTRIPVDQPSRQTCEGFLESA